MDSRFRNVGLARLLIPLLGFLYIASAPGATTAAPKFEDYPVTTVYPGKITPPRFSKADRESDLRCFRGDAGKFDYSQYKPNFAGRFVIEACTCGSGCHYLYMWDAMTGKAFTNFPAMPIDVGPFFDRGQDLPPIEYGGEDYRVDSSLLVIEGCKEDTCDCASRYYRWDGKTFRLLKRVSKPRVACPFK